MARDGSGTYNLTAGQPVAINTVIDETVFNTLMTDVALALTNSLAANGETPATAAIPFAEGITIPTGKAVTGSGTASVSGFQLVAGTVVRPGFATTATAAGTTTLTAASAQIQEFTGTTTQTVVMPVTTTLTAGHPYDIINNSIGALTINSSGGNLIQTLYAGERATISCVLASGTTAASWAVSPQLPGSIAGQTLQSFALVITLTGATMQHKINSDPVSGVLGNFSSKITAANAALQNTPTGADASTAMAFGGKISSAGSGNSFILDTAAQVIANEIATANIVYNDTGTALLASLQFVSTNVNGVTRIRPQISFSDATTGAAFALAMNIGAGKAIWVKVNAYLS